MPFRKRFAALTTQMTQRICLFYHCHITVKGGQLSFPPPMGELHTPNLRTTSGVQWLCLFQPMSQSHVFAKIVRSGEVSVAELAGEGFLSGVAAQMFPEVLLGGKGAVAGGTGVGPLARVHVGMDAQLGRTREFLEAYPTGENPPKIKIICVSLEKIGAVSVCTNFQSKVPYH